MRKDKIEKIEGTLMEQRENEVLELAKKVYDEIVSADDIQAITAELYLFLYQMENLQKKFKFDISSHFLLWLENTSRSAFKSSDQFIKLSNILDKESNDYLFYIFKENLFNCFKNHILSEEHQNLSFEYLNSILDIAKFCGYSTDDLINSLNNTNTNRKKLKLLTILLNYLCPFDYDILLKQLDNESLF